MRKGMDFCLKVFLSCHPGAKVTASISQEAYSSHCLEWMWAPSGQGGVQVSSGVGDRLIENHLAPGEAHFITAS